MVGAMENWDWGEWEWPETVEDNPNSNPPNSAEVLPPNPDQMNEVKAGAVGGEHETKEIKGSTDRDGKTKQAMRAAQSTPAEWEKPAVEPKRKPKAKPTKKKAQENGDEKKSKTYNKTDYGKAKDDFFDAFPSRIWHTSALKPTATRITQKGWSLC